MKEAIGDIFKMIELETGNIIEKFENSIEKVSNHHNINREEIDSYFNKEVLEQLGE